MGIFPSWINAIPSEYPIIIYPTSPISSISHIDPPPVPSQAEYQESAPDINSPGVIEVIYG